jgi:hypothetical protein
LQPQKLARVRFCFYARRHCRHFSFLNYRSKIHSIKQLSSCSRCRNGALIILKPIY